MNAIALLAFTLLACLLVVCIIIALYAILRLLAAGVGAIARRARVRRRAKGSPGARA